MKFINEDIQEIYNLHMYPEVEHSEIHIDVYTMCNMIYTQGKKRGYCEGQRSGHVDGYSEGYNTGHNDGYEDGYINGLHDGNSTGETV